MRFLKHGLPLAFAGLLCAFVATQAKADTVYSVTLQSVSQTSGSCYTDFTSATVGTLTLYSAGGLDLTFGGTLGSTGCNALFPSGTNAANGGTVTNPVVSTTVGTFTDLYGEMCNDANCNGVSPSYSDHAVAGFTAANTFELTDQFPPPDGHGTNGGSFVLTLNTGTVPEPTDVALLTTGLFGLMLIVRRRMAARAGR